MPRAPRVSPAPMDGAGAAVPSPPPPPPVRSRRALACAAIVYLFLAAMWLLFASSGAIFIGRAACGDRCAVVAAARRVSRAAAASLVVLALAAAVCFVSLALAARDAKAEKAPDPEDITPAERPVLYVLLLGMLACLPFLLLTFVGCLVRAFSPVKGSHGERIGSIVIDVGFLSIVALSCFVILPALALSVWRRMSVLGQRT